MTRLLDFFGVEGELTLNGSSRFGSVFGGILTLLSMLAIISTAYYYSSVYLGNNNYFATTQINR